MQWCSELVRNTVKDRGEEEALVQSRARRSSDGRTHLDTNCSLARSASMRRLRNSDAIKTAPTFSTKMWSEGSKRK